MLKTILTPVNSTIVRFQNHVDNISEDMDKSKFINIVENLTMSAKKLSTPINLIKWFCVEKLSTKCESTINSE